MKPKRQKARRSDRLRQIRDNSFQIDDEQSEDEGLGRTVKVSDEALRHADARKALERYMEERALQAAIADDIF